MSDHSHDIDVLNGLIETTIDSVDGYQKAAEDARNPQFAELFQRRSADRAKVVAALNEAVRQQGGEPEHGGTLVGSAHRVFTGLRAAMSKGDKAVIEEMERSEDHIKHRYEAALQDEELSAMSRDLILQCYTSVLSGHDQMRAIKRSVEG